MRDCFFVVCKDDLDAICKQLETNGFSKDAIEKMKQKDWGFFLKNCRRVIPDAQTLLKRIKKLFEIYEHIQYDKEMFFRANTVKAFKNLFRHIEAGCLSDIDGISIYQEMKKDSLGILFTGIMFIKVCLFTLTYSCIRGTNKNEGYHKHLWNLTNTYALSPTIVHSLLLSFNYRWNARAAVKHLGVDFDLSMYFQIEIIEYLQQLKYIIYQECRFSGYKSMLGLADTRERFGFRCDLDDNEKALENIVIPIKSTNNADENLRILLGKSRQFSPIRTKEERDKFNAELSQYLNQGNSSSNAQFKKERLIDFDAWTQAWNLSVKNSRILNIFMKQADHLIAHYQKMKKSMKTIACLKDVREYDHGLVKELREPSYGKSSRLLIIFFMTF